MAPAIDPLREPVLISELVEAFAEREKNGAMECVRAAQVVEEIVEPSTRGNGT